MASKKKILNKIKILITQTFDNPQKAFSFFDKDSNGKLTKKELRHLIKNAGVNGFISGVAASKMVKGLDKSGDSELDWQEFKKAVDSLLKEA